MEDQGRHKKLIAEIGCKVVLLPESHLNLAQPTLDWSKCYVCKKGFHGGTPAITIIRERRVYHDPRTRKWVRTFAHTRCAELPAIGQQLSVQHRVLEFGLKRDRSARTLLFLQALDLPWDVAWPIAAIIHWLL